MDDLWGEELSDDVIEECLLVASQVEANMHRSAPNSSILTGAMKEVLNDDRCGQSTLSRIADDCFAVPPPRRSFDSSSSNPKSTGPGSVSDSGFEELAKLRTENQRLYEENTARSGETSILRAEILKLQQSLQKKEQEMLLRVQQLQNEVKEKEALRERNAQSFLTEMKFKDLEIGELQTKCKRLEREQPVPPPPMTSTPKPTSSPPKFLNRAAFNANMCTPIRKAKPAPEPSVGVELVPGEERQDPETKQTTPNPIKQPEDWNDLLREVCAELSAATHHKDKSFALTGTLDRITRRLVENPGDSTLLDTTKYLLHIVCSYLSDCCVPGDAQHRPLIDFLTVYVSRGIDEKDECNTLLEPVLDALSSVLEHKCTSQVHSVVQLVCAVVELRWSALCAYPKGCLLRDCARLLQSEMESSTSRNLMISILTLTGSLLTSETGRYADTDCQCAYQSILLFTEAVEKVISQNNESSYSECLLQHSLHVVLALLSLNEAEPLNAVVQRKNVRVGLINLLDYYGPDLDTGGTEFGRKGPLYKYLGYPWSTTSGDQ